MTTRTLPRTALRTTGIAVAFSGLLAPALFGGNGSSGTPWLNAEVTNLTLNSGGGTPSYNELNAFAATQWDATKNLPIASTTNYNNLNILNGSTVNCLDFNMGLGSIADITLGASNMMQVSASTITAAGDFYVGVLGSMNFAFMTNSSVVTCGNLYIGGYTCSTGNTLDIGEGTSFTATNRAYIGGAGPDNALMMVNAALTCDEGCVGHTDGANGNVANVGGASSLFKCKTKLTVGFNSNGNALRVFNAGKVTAPHFYIGYGVETYSTYGTGNSVTIEDANSSIGVSVLTAIGTYGGSNSLKIANGGTLSTLSFALGGAAYSTYNTLTVSGTGSSLVADTGTIGASGSSNSVLISEGALATLTNLTVGYLNAAYGNSFTVTGAGTSATVSSIWDGDYGVGNLVLVDDGAFLSASGDIKVGPNAPDTGTCSDNSLKVRGPGSYLGIASNLSIGAAATLRNLATVENGAVASVGTGGSGTLTVGTGTDNALRLANGKIALKNMLLADVNALLARGVIKVWNASTKTWDSATAATVTIATIPAGKSKAMTGVDGLDGCLLVSGGDDHINWSNATLIGHVTVGSGDNAYVGGWYSSWYGKFYAAPGHDGRWIWHTQHGWQYIASLNSSEFAVWDSAMQTWWYVNQAYYPAIYNYGDSAWYYFTGGSTPNRSFWDYASSKEIHFTEN